MAKSREQPEHRALIEVRQLVAELAEARVLIDHLMAHVKRLSDACCDSLDPRTRDIGLEYRTAGVLKRPDAPLATLIRAGPPPVARLPRHTD